MNRPFSLLLVVLSLLTGACTSSVSGADAGGDDVVEKDRPALESGAVDVSGDVPIGEGGCASDNDCDDHLYCNGAERCISGRCNAGVSPCDDRYSCTRDLCDEETRVCGHEADHSVCGDGNACNGTELCDPSMLGAMAGTGCQPVRPDNQIDCDDGNNCTLDACDNRVGCIHAPRDLDGDGYVSNMCAVDGTPRGMLGNDCNDSDPRVFPGAREVCDDGRDNNCNGLTDFADTAACVPSNGTCATAQEIRLAGVGNYSAIGSTSGLTGSTSLTCSTSARAVAVYSFTLTTTQDISINTDDAATGAAVALLSTCSPVAELRCARATGTFPVVAPSMSLRSVSPGTYFIMVQTSTARVFRLRMTVGRPTVAPENDVCPAAGATLPGNLADGMPHMVNFTGFAADYSSSCDAGSPTVSGPDAVFPLVLTGPRNVAIQATLASAGTAVVSIYGAPCGAVTSQIRCLRVTSATQRLNARNLAAGTYWVIVRTDAGQAVTLQATLTDPTMRVAGDVCPGVEARPDGGPLMLATSTFDTVPDHGTTCGSTGTTDGWTDAVVRFTLTEPRDVTVVSTSTASSYRMMLETTCGTLGSLTGPCLTASVGSTGVTRRYRGLTAGTYYLIFESNTGLGTLSVNVMTTAPGVRLPGDSCPGLDVTVDGAPSSLSPASFDPTSDIGTACGSTRGGVDGWTDWVYRFSIRTPRDVTLTMIGLPSSARMQLVSSCAAGAPPIGGCLSGSTMLERRYRALPAGDYYVIGESNVAVTGAVRLIVSTTDPGTRAPADTCATAVAITPDAAAMSVPLGGLDTVPDHGTTCGSLASPTGTWSDFVTRFTLTAERDVLVTANLTPGTTFFGMLESTCGDPRTLLRSCLTSSATGTWAQRYSRLAPGTYYLMGEARTLASGAAVSVQVTTSAPGVRPSGDTCGTAAVVVPDGPATTLPIATFDNTADHGTTCGSSAMTGAAFTDWVARYTLTAPRDVVITMRPSTSIQMYGMVETMCGVPGSVTGTCLSTFGAWTQRIRSQPAGTYYILGEARAPAAGTAIDITVSTTAPGATPGYTQGTPPADVTFVNACAATGHTNLVASTDDSSALTALPFAFRYWGVMIPSGSSVNVTSNGWLGLDGVANNALSGSIPSSSTPNSVVAPYWSDNYTRTDGVCVATVGASPSRKWVAEWSDTFHCCGDDGLTHITYEVILNEGTNTIDFLYQTMTGARMNTVGLENQDGSDGIVVGTMPIAGTRIRFTPTGT